MVQIGYTMMTEQAGPRDLVDHVVRRRAGRVRLLRDVRPLLPVAGLPGARPVRVECARGGRAGHGTHSADDVRDLSDDPLPPGGRGAEGRDDAAAVARGASGWGSAPGRTSTSTWWAAVGLRRTSGTRCWRRPSRSSARCSRAGTSRSTGPISTWTRRGCGTCPTSRRRSGSPSRASVRARSPAGSADLVIATEPKPGLLDAFDRHGGAGKPRVGQLPVCYDADRDAAVARAHAQFRWFGSGWKVNSELPRPRRLRRGATQFVTPDDVASVHPLRRRRRTTSSRPCAPTPRPGSRRSPWSRSAATSSRRTWTGRRRPCCPLCARPSAEGPRADRPDGRRVGQSAANGPI